MEEGEAAADRSDEKGTDMPNVSTRDDADDGDGDSRVVVTARMTSRAERSSAASTGQSTRHHCEAVRGARFQEKRVLTAAASRSAASPTLARISSHSSRSSFGGSCRAKSVATHPVDQ